VGALVAHFWRKRHIKKTLFIVRIGNASRKIYNVYTLIPQAEQGYLVYAIWGVDPDMNLHGNYRSRKWKSSAFREVANVANDGYDGRYDESRNVEYVALTT
jgi:hypothetical protein